MAPGVVATLCRTADSEGNVSGGSPSPDSIRFIQMDFILEEDLPSNSKKEPLGSVLVLSVNNTIGLPSSQCLASPV